MRAFLLAFSLTAAVATAAPSAATAPALPTLPTLPATTDAPLLGFTSSSSAAERDMERRVDASLAGADLDGWLRRLTSAPNHVGSPHNDENARFIADSLRQWGWDVQVESTRVLVAYPTVQKLALLDGDRYAADFTEPAVAGDADTARRDGVLPGMEAYSPDGVVDAPMIYVNEGLAKDYADLARTGQSVAGKVVLVKSSGAGRWVKPRLAQQHGAVGVVIYSDPEADGFTKGEVYPTGAWRTPRTVQRGTLGIDSVLDAASATTFQKARHTDDLSIPVVTIGYGDAEHFLQALGGRVVPNRWQGGLPLTYHVGGETRVHLEVRSPWEWRTLHNVVATLRGSRYPDEWVIRGVHHDAWVYGAWDPLAGTTALLAEAKAIGELAKAGMRPKRTLVFASWDGEELGILGSRAWTERHAAELARKAVFYLNNDTTGRGLLAAQGDPSIGALVDSVAADLSDPETGASVQARRLAKRAVDADERGRDAPVGPILLPRVGTGSDYLAFAHRFGVPSLHVRYGYDRDGDEESVPVYHSLYDTYAHYQRFGDPGLAYVGLLARTNARLALRVANADVLPWRFTAFAQALGRDIDTLQGGVDRANEQARRRNTLLADGSYRLAEVAYRQLQPPAHADEAWQPVDLDALRAAQRDLWVAATAYDAAAQAAGDLPPERAIRINRYLREVGDAYLQAGGLPQRREYRHLLQAPGRKEGEDVAPLPGIGDAIDAKAWDEARAETALTVDATHKAIDALRRATVLLSDKAP